MYHKKKGNHELEIVAVDGLESKFPALVVRQGRKCQKRFATFFTDNVRNANQLMCNSF